MAPYVLAAILHDMEILEHIGAIAIAAGAAVLFALMAWAGQHQS
jgi:hypothetical protein